MTSPGRSSTPDRDLNAQRIRELGQVRGIQCGYRHTAESMALPGQSPPYHAVYAILHLVTVPVDRPVRIHDHRFVAKYVNYLWHTDLHEIQVPDDATGGTRIIYLIAFLDDASRFIMQHRLVRDKRSATCTTMRCCRRCARCGHLLASSEVTIVVSSRATHFPVFLANTG
jgi:hypothetical protein